MSILSLWFRLLVFSQIFWWQVLTQESKVDESKYIENLVDENYVFTEIPEDKNYRSWTGPAEEYDLMGATQFNLLTSLGLREGHTLLDYGCGSLRAGRFFMLYLLKGNYYCVESYDSLIRDAINFEVGRDLLVMKEPHLYKSNWDEFDAGVFEKYDFDFIIAQSIFSHTGKKLMIHLLDSIRGTLAPEGLALVTIIHLHNDMPEEPIYNGYEWIYPGVVEFHPKRVPTYISEAKLHGEPLNWYHPRQTWWALSKSQQRVEWAQRTLSDLRGLNVYAGKVLNH